MASKKTDTIIIPIQIDENGLNRMNENINETVETTKSLKAQLREMTLELQNIEPGTQRFFELTAAAGQLKDQINDTNAAIKATAGSATENLAKGLGNVASVGIAGFQGLASAQALFGAESENVQKALLKLQALAGLGDAVKSLGALGDTMTEIKASFLAAATQLGLFTTAKEVDTVVTGAQTVATEGATVATATLGTTMNALPIFAIIAGITAVVGAIAYFASQTEEAAISQEDFNQVATETGKALGDAKKNVNEVGLAFQNAGKGVGSKKKALELYNDKFGETLGIAKNYEEAEKTFVKNADVYIQVSALRAKADAFRALSAQASADAFVKSQEVEISALQIAELVKTKILKGDKAAVAELRQSVINQRKEAQAESDRKIKALDDEANKFATKATQLESTLVKINQDGNEKKVSSTKKTAEDIKKIQEEANAKYIESEDAKFKLENDLTLSETEKKKVALQEAYDKQVAIAGDDEGLIKLATQKLQSDLTQIDTDAENERLARAKKANDDYIAQQDAAFKLESDLFLTESEKKKLALQQEYDKKVELAGDDEGLIKEATIQLQDGLNAIDVEAANKARALEQEKQRSKVQLASDAIGALGGLISSFSANSEKDARRQFNINKAFSLGQAAINTGLAVTAALTAGGNPAKLATGAQFVEAGIAAAVGAANIVKIASSKFGGAGSGGNTTVPTPTTSSNTTATSGPASPSFNLFGSGGQENNVGPNGPIGGNQNITVTAVVSETDVTNVQNKVKGIKTNAEL